MSAPVIQQEGIEKKKETYEIFEDDKSDDEEEDKEDLELGQSDKFEDVSDGGGQRPPFPASAVIPTHTHALCHPFSILVLFKNRVICSTIDRKWWQGK
ncbi:hypothetical protein GOBAR_AA09440 [Gossypium barbadense]|uniref:Uncharacterized protein n=1 Tax=Gossypium barbadense TaxID=3634 RepID=A0A2P5Y6K9_GOSBA|nr:hypothetical protein GOBAR_AA09440 [Gossypium barbadense]